MGIFKMASKLKLVWDRDNPRYELIIQGFRIVRASEYECLDVAVSALERSLIETKGKLAKVAAVRRGER